MKRIFFLLAATAMFTACADKTIDPDITFRYKLGGGDALVLMSDGENRVSETLLHGLAPGMLSVLDYDGKPLNSFNSFLLEMGGQKYMFDTGTGARAQYNHPRAGLDPQEVTKIYLTHLHGDHIGGMLRDGKRVFPNATVYISQPEYDYWTNEQVINSFPSHKRSSFNFARRVLDAYSGQIELFTPATLADGGTELEEGITAYLAPGHTPGHTIYLIGEGRKRVLLWGDITHVTELQLSYPTVSISYDVDDERAVKTRREVLDYVCANGLTVGGMHVVYPAIGRVSREGDGSYRFKAVRAPKRNNFEL